MSKLVPPHGSNELKILALEGDDLEIEQKKIKLINSGYLLV